MSKLTDFATVWHELFQAEQERVVRLLVERVGLREDALEVRICVDGLASLVQPDAAERLRVPVARDRSRLAVLEGRRVETSAASLICLSTPGR
jgi:hypothetical protein